MFIIIITVFVCVHATVFHTCAKNSIHNSPSPILSPSLPLLPFSLARLVYLKFHEHFYERFGKIGMKVKHIEKQIM